MENTDEILAYIRKIREAYTDKVSENENLFNIKEIKSAEINNEIEKNREENLERIKYLNSKLESLEKEKSKSYDFSISDDMRRIVQLQNEKEKIEEQIKKLKKEQNPNSENETKINKLEKKLVDLETEIKGLEPKLNRSEVIDEKESSSWEENVEKEYQRKFAELNAKLAEISKKEDERENLIELLTDLQINKEKYKEDYVRSKTDPRFKDIADVVRVNYKAEHAKRIDKLTERIANITVEIGKKDEITSELAKLKLDRYNFFGRATPDSTIKRKNADERHNIKSNENFKEAIYEEESKIIDQITEIANETIKRENELNNQLSLVPGLPDFSRVYLKEMFELKFELGQILKLEEQKLKSELYKKSTIIDEINNPIEIKLQEKMKEAENIADRIDYLRSLSKVDRENYTIPENDEEEQLKKKLNQYRQEIKELMNEKEDASSKTKHLGADINKLNKALETINKLMALINPKAEEFEAYNAPFTMEEQKEYDRRQASQKNRINNIMNPKMVENSGLESDVDSNIIDGEIKKNI